MTRAEKVTVIDKLAEKLDQNVCFYITDASGLTVEQTNAFRRLCFKAGIEYNVYKNTLIRKAFAKQNIQSEELLSALQGFSGIMFSKEIGNLPARVIKEYRKTVKEKPLLKIAYINTDLYSGDKNLEELSKLKSRDEVIGDLMSLLQSPIKTVVSACLSGQHVIANIVKSIKEKVE